MEYGLQQNALNLVDDDPGVFGGACSPGRRCHPGAPYLISFVIIRQNILNGV
jgi:hypothetical protein